MKSGDIGDILTMACIVLCFAWAIIAFLLGKVVEGILIMMLVELVSIEQKIDKMIDKMKECEMYEDDVKKVVSRE